MDSQRIDFVVIGAAKAATTSLHHYLLAHPDIFMPGAKELAFFSSPHNWDKGTDWYFQWFADAPANALVGEVSPQYMRDDATPQRMAQVLPETRLIACLRNPIDRAYSHFRHTVVEGGLPAHDFAGYLRLLHAGDTSRTVREFREVLRYGEYGRILSAYLRHFPADNLQIVHFEDLQNDTDATLAGLCQWLGLERGVPPTALSKQHNVGGAMRYPRLGRAVQELARWARRQPLLYRAATRVVPRERLRATWWWLRKEFNRKRTTAPPLSADERALAARYYRDDVSLLEQCLNRPMPWADFPHQSSDLETPATHP